MDSKIIWYVVALIAILVAGYFMGFFGKQIVEYNGPAPPPGYVIPQGPLHWHPWLKIIVKGQEQKIPDNIGITIGKTMDLDIGSDMGAAPIHTHDGAEDQNPNYGRKLHMESLAPYKKPISLTLGYFFDIWGKTFNDTCIFEYCNGPNEIVKMFVNDKPNTDFENYFMRDGDRILIVYD